MFEMKYCFIWILLISVICCVTVPGNSLSNGSAIPLPDTSIKHVGTEMAVKQVGPETRTLRPQPKNTFKDEEKAIFDFVNSILRQLLSRVVKGASTNISPRCTSAILKIFGGIRKLQGWTLQMLDSIGKPTSGILRGTPYSMANYDQCLNISITHRGRGSSKPEDELFHGRYCRIRLELAEAVLSKAREYKQGKINSSELGKLKEMIMATPYIPFMKNPMSHFLGLCVPSLCDTEDITKLLESLPFPGSATLERCEENKVRHVDFEKRIILGIFSLMILVAAIGTAVDKLVHFLAEENLNVYLEKKCIAIAISFSVFSNTKKLFQRIENDHKDLPNWRVIRGLIVGTIFCLIVYNTYLPPFDAFYLQSSNLSNLENYLNHKYFSLTVCLPIVIETLFLSYGFSLTHKIWKSTWKKGKKEVNLVQIILSNYVRLCLPLLLCNGIIILLPLIGSGPFWKDVFGTSHQNCQKYWWRHVAMIGNFFDEKEQCFPHFWFVPCLMQITTIATVMMKIVSRYRKFGISMTIGLVVGCHIVVGIITFNGEYPPSYIAYFFATSSDGFWKINSIFPLNHAGSFAVGMLLGIYVAKGTRIRLNPITRAIGWIVSIGCLIGICLLMYPYRKEDVILPPIWSVFYAASHRILFSVAIGWMFLVSAHHDRSIVGKILSWSVLDPLYKMSYFAYLIHPVIMAYHIGTSREHFGYSHVETVMRSLSYVCLTYIASYVGCLSVDLPIKSLRSALFPSNFRQVNITSFKNIIEFQQQNKDIGTGNFNPWTMETAKPVTKY